MSGTRLDGLDAAELQDALDAGDITIALQPLVSVRTGELVRLEALARWSHPTRGEIPPANFIPIAERGPQITALTSAVLLQVARHLPAWRQQAPHLEVDVNVSMVSLREPGFVELLAEFMGSYGLEPTWLGFELTESIFVRDPEATAEAIEAIRSLGCRVSIDDFATGYSSLGHLASLPVTAVKIDREFVAPMATDHRRAAIVRAVIGLGHDLGFEVVAEGVEDAETLELLRAIGCDLAQGFHIARPLRAQAVAAWIAAPPSTADRAPTASPVASASAVAELDATNSGPRVLVVDDEPAIVTVLRDILEERGVLVTTAANGAEALAALETARPHVVLLDMQMPVLDGERVIAAMRERGLHVPIVVMTAGPSAERWARELNVEGFFRKPFRIDSVLNVTTQVALDA